MTEPDSYAEVLCCRDYPIWQKAMEIEMAQHAEVGTWMLVDLPVGKNVVGCPRLKLMLKGILNSAKRDWLRRGSHNGLAWITSMSHPRLSN